MALFEWHDATVGADYSRQPWRSGAGPGLRMARIVQPTRNAPRHATVRWVRNVSGRLQHVGKRTRLGALRTALPQRRQNWRRTYTARRLGGVFRQGYAKHPLRRRL